MGSWERVVYVYSWLRAQSRRVKMEKEQLKHDYAEMEQKQLKHDHARARKRKQRDSASEESKTKEKESDRLRKKFSEVPVGIGTSIFHFTTGRH